jgi:thiamine-phosphate pyrophosphorylase
VFRPTLLLYYITDRTQLPGDEATRRSILLTKIDQAAKCGVDFIQLREKDLRSRELESLAQAAARIVRESSCLAQQTPKTRLLINSRVDVAIACGADGVHLRSDDISVKDVRDIWESTGRDETPVVSISCHSSGEVAQAVYSGADFVVFAPVFEKKDMPQTSPAGLDALHDASRHNMPIFALGGVNLDNAVSCIKAGAAGIAGIRLFQEQGIAETVRRLRPLK